jgi:ketosteroid isomerase-like protein
MDAATVRSMFEQHFERSRQGDSEGAHAIYLEDAVLEFPQSGERFEGVGNFREWRSRYPAETSFEIGEIRGGDDVWVIELTVTYDHGPRNFGVSIIEFRGERIARETIYVAEPFEAPEWRASWRAAP